MHVGRKSSVITHTEYYYLRVIIITITEDFPSMHVSQILVFGLETCARAKFWIYPAHYLDKSE